LPLNSFLSNFKIENVEFKNMRFNILFNRTTKQRMLPMDYQYYISAWIYKVLKQADRDFALFLHEKGYGQNEAKLYKLFCFSRLNFGKPKLWKEKKLFEISEHTISLQISFDVTEAASNFIKGLFMSQEFYLGDKFNGIDFKVAGVEVLPEPQFNETMKYRLITPWVVSIKEPDKPQPVYLSANNPRFTELAAKHISEKFNLTRPTERPITPEEIKLNIESSIKRSGLIVKPNTPQETRVVGNLFNFSLTAPTYIHQMIWSTGISEKSSTGFGWLEM